MNRGRYRLFWLAGVLACAAAGCAHRAVFDSKILIESGFAPGTFRELTGVPFFPQRVNHCGPAALATVAGYAGVSVEPDDIAGQVYLPGKKGSLQVDLLGAARRRNLIPYVINGSPRALLEQLALGRPVLVLQNLGLSRFPQWHYAVLVGFDADRQRFVLRSGGERRQVVRARRFLSTWGKAGSWGFVLLRPDEFPIGVERQRHVAALSALEGVSSPETLVTGFAMAARRWPDDALVLMGWANAWYLAGNREQAMAVFRQLLRIHPDHVAARNNLAHVLWEEGCVAEAREQIGQVTAVVQPGHPLYPLVQDTDALLKGGARERPASAAHCLVREGDERGGETETTPRR